MQDVTNDQKSMTWRGGRWRPFRAPTSTTINKKESACKPGSVENSHSSGTRVATRLKQPTRGPPRVAVGGLIRPALLFGLAPDGVFPAATVASDAVRSYRTFSPLPVLADFGGLAFCGTFRGLAPPRRYL